MFKPTIPDEMVAMVRGIINQDRRERQAAGYKLGTAGLAARIAKEFGINLWTVMAIKKRRRRKHVAACRLFQETVTVTKERLAEANAELAKKRRSL